MAQIAKIQEISANDVSTFVLSWRFQTSWTVGGSTFQYPNHRGQLDRFRWLLENYARADPLNSLKASQIRKELEHYRNVLFTSLSETQVSPNTRYVDVHDHGEESSFHSIPWELVESRQSSIIVRRRVNSGPLAAVQKTSTSETFNILIIAARALEDDVDYRQAALPILQVIQDLPDGAPLVTVELVRPGKFESLKEHLEDAKNCRGGFSYHLVHLDLHGKLNETGEATLAFADKVVSASKVSQLLTRHGVQYAVINACESARGDRGAKGNVAKTFVKGGMIAVLAMSYKISVSVVSFMALRFYEAFLQRNLPFARAAHAARQAMRQQPQRKGRFGLSVELEDWMVPVIYSSIDDDPVVRSGKTVSRSHQRLPVFFRRTDDSIVPKPTELDGRDADILKLEEQLLENSQKGIGRLVFLEGPNGVGKTSLLRHLQWWWASTGMITRSIYVDMNDYREKSLNDIYNHLIRQLGEHRPDKGKGESPMNRLRVHLRTMAQEEDKESSWRDPKPLLIFDHLFSTDWPLGKRPTVMKGTEPETWKTFFQMLSESQVFTIAASHRWPWYLDDHESSEFTAEMIFNLAPIALNRADLTLRTGGDQTLAGLIKDQNEIEKLDLILNWCGPDLALLNIILPLVGKLGAAQTAMMLTRGDDLLGVPGFPRQLLKRLPMWKVSKSLWKNAPKSLRELLIAFAPFHGCLPRCHEAYCVGFVVNKLALTRPVRNYFAKFSPKTAKVWDQRELSLNLLLLVEHLRLLPVLKSMGLIQAHLMMGPTVMRSGLSIGPGRQPEGSMLHSIHPVFSLFLRHKAGKAGYLRSKQGTLSRKAICLEKTFVDYHEKRGEELLERSSTLELWSDSIESRSNSSEIMQCRLSFTAAMDIHLQSPMDRFEKIFPIPAFLHWNWANPEVAINNILSVEYITNCTEKALSRCQEELSKTTDPITQKDIAITAAQLTLLLATHLVSTGQYGRFASYISMTDDFLGMKYFRDLTPGILDSLWPERAPMVDHLNVLKRMQGSIESHELTELTLFAELPLQTVSPSLASESLSSGWNIIRRALKVTEDQLQLYAKTRSLKFWDTQDFCQSLECQRNETDYFLTALAPIWPELLSSCDSEFISRVRMLGFDEDDDRVAIPDEFWDDIVQDFLEGSPPIPSYASSFMAAIREGTSADQVRHDFWTRWQTWVQVHARSWVLKLYDLSTRMENEHAKSILENGQIALLSQLGDWELTLEHQQCLLVVERALSFQELSKSQLSARIAWHFTTASCALRLSRWDLCYDNLGTILGITSDGGNIEYKQLFQTLELFALLQMMAPPAKPYAVSIMEALYRALRLGYENRGIYARNGAILSLLLHSTEPGCLARSKASLGRRTDSVLATVKPEVQAHIEFMLSSQYTSSSSSDRKDPDSDLAAVKRLQHTQATFSNSAAFFQCLQQQLNARRH